MKKITFLLFALLFSFVGYSQFPTPGTEGFENTTGPDLALPVAVSPWTLGTGATGNQWAVFDNGVAGSPQKRWDRATTNFYNGTQAAFINRKQNGAAGVVSEDYLATPLVTVPANGQLTFYTRTGFNVADAVNYLIKVNTNTTAGSQTTLANYTTTVQSWDQTTIAATYNVYELKTVDLSAYAGQQIFIAFVRNFNQPTAALGGNSWYIDDVKLVQRCLEPTTLTATGITQSTANLSWTNPSGSTSWEIEVIPSTSSPTGVGVVYNGTLPYVATGLTPTTGYVYYVRSLCSNSNSNWVGPYNFTTLTPGLTCATAITVSSLPYSTSDNTANYGDTYDVTQPTACAGTATNYMQGNDVFYAYTATTTGAISVTMTPTGSSSGVFVYQGCSNVGVTCLAGVANTGSGVRTIPSLNVTAGQTYIIVLSSSATTQTYPYSLVIQQLNCAQPTALAVANTTSTGTQLSWTNATSTSWEYAVQTAGSAIPSGSGTQTSSSTNTPVTGLTPDTAYQYWVRADCGNGTFSAWAGPFAFTTAVAPPVCGGLFVDAGGQAGNYANNSNITYPICPVNPGDQVTVTFTSFNTQLNTDLLKVYNGNGTTGTLLATYSGTTIPPAVTSSSPDGCLTFVFTSDGTTNAAGWVANVTCAPAPSCQSPIVLNTSAISYNSVTVGWTQPQNPDTSVASAWEVIALPCGSAAPTATATGVISASSNPFAVTGLSPLTCYDFYVRAVCSSSSSSLWSGPVSATTTVAPVGCGGNFVDSGGISGNYSNNENTPTLICPTNSTDVVTVTFTAFNTQANNDVLKVYDGSNASAPLIGTYSGNLTTTLPGPIVSSVPGGCLYFVFTSNASTTRAGWVANITCAPAPTCPKPTALVTSSVTSNSGTLTWTNNSTAIQFEMLALPCGSAVPTASSSGTIITPTTNTYTFTGLTPLTCYTLYVRAVCSSSDSSLWSAGVNITTLIAPPACGGNFVDSGGASGNYSNNENITTTICATNPTDLVTVTFTSFNVENSFDFLNVYDGNSATGTLLGTYTGTTLPPAMTNSTPGGCLTFVFTSDSSVTSTGWVANITCAPAPTCPAPSALATSAVTSNSGTLTWTNNSTATQFEMLALPCGSAAPTASSTGIIITPTTNNTYTFTGLTPNTCYTLYLRAVCSSTDSSVWSTGINITTLLAPPACGGTFTDPGGASGNYANSSNVTTVICPSSGQQATVTFTSFDLEDGFDFLNIYDGNSTTGTLLGTYTGTTLPPSVTSSTVDGCLTFVFTSDSSVTATGWVANVTCAPPPTCPKPTAVSVSNITQNSATIAWTQIGTATSWQILVLPAGSPAPTATSTGWVTATTNPFNYSGFTSGSKDVYIRAVCSTTDSSFWSNVVSFATPPPSCINNTAAGNTCAIATPICNLNGYCGNTSASYTADYWPELLNAFCGSIENNSFLTFVASSSTISFDVWVTNSQQGGGIQIMVFSAATCGSGPVTSYTCWSPGTVASGAVNVSATGLTVGNTYYIMIDGFAGDVCSYVIASSSGIQSPVLISESTQTNTSTICLGQTATLNATGGTGQYTWSPATNLSAATGSSVVFTPTTIGTYTLTATSSDNNPLCPQSSSSSQTITVTGMVTPTFTQIAPFCVGTTAPVLPTSSNDATPITGTWSPSVVDNTTVGTTQYTFTPSSTQCANPITMSITVNPGTTPLFLEPAPFCAGATAPVLPTTSTNGITGTWSPATVSNTASGTYTFTPTSGQCASTVTMNITVNTNCAFGSYASAVWLANCSTSNFFNTVGSGADIIGPASNIFPDSNLGTYLQNSSSLMLKGAEIKTFKNASSNVCSARLNYRIYPQAGTPGTFQVMDLPWFSDCGSGAFNVGGGPCNVGDQKWHKVLPDALYPTENPIDLTTYPPGNYTIQVYYDISGSSTTTTGCSETVFIDNNGAYYTASFTIQAQPSYTSTNPTTCGGTNGSITISGLAPNTSYGVSYIQNTEVTVGPQTISSDNNGTIVINGLNAGTYSNFLVTINGCSYPYNTPIVLVDPTPPSVSVNSPTVCASQPATVTATPTSIGNYSYAWTVPTSGTDPGNVATFTTTVAGVYSVVITDTTTGCLSTSASGTVGFNPVIVPTFATIPTVCNGATAPVLPTSSTNATPITGTWLPASIDSTVAGDTTFTFTPDLGQCSQPISIVVTVTPAITIQTTVTQPTCALPSGTIQVTSPISSLGATPTDLFISEVTDSNSGSLSYIELFNGTGATINLSNYAIKTANNGNAYSFTLPLNNVNLTTGSTYVIALGNDDSCPSTPGGDGSLAAQSSPSGSVNFAVNGNDHFGLFNGTTQIDSWGIFGNSNWAPSSIGTEGADFRRKNTISPLPNTTYNNSDWDIIDYAGSGAANCANNDYSNIGIYSLPPVSSYQYSIDGGAYSSNTTFAGLPTGDHIVSVLDTTTGCSASTTVTINTATPVPAVTTFSYTSPVCANVAATLTPTPSVGFTSGGQYTASPVGLLIDANTGVVNLASSTPGTYSVTYTVLDNSALCISGTSSSTPLVINVVPTATVNSPSACAGQSATVTATALPTTGTYNYVWTNTVGATDPGNVSSFGATMAGTYSVIVTDALSGCASASASGTVTINALPTVTVNSPTVCQGQTATVTAVASPTGTFTYVWTVPTGASNPGNVATFNATVSGNYGVTITDTTTGCTSVSATSTVTINALPTVTVTGDTVCQGSQATITANPIPTTGTYNYVWTGPTTPGNVASFTTTTAGTYSVIITDTTTGCTSVSASGTAAFIPAFDFTINGECIDNNFILEVIPTGSTLDLNTSHFDWQFNSVSTGFTDATFNVTNYVHSLNPAPQLPLTFSVNVTTADGCQQIHPITLDRIYCDIQKGISPNPIPDGKNDFFDLRLMNVQTLSIFNRYGTKVYSKGDYTNEWIGQSDSGSELPDGTYYYVIDFKNDQPTKTGWIYINRQNK